MLFLEVFIFIFYDDMCIFFNVPFFNVNLYAYSDYIVTILTFTRIAEQLLIIILF